MPLKILNEKMAMPVKISLFMDHLHEYKFLLSRFLHNKLFKLKMSISYSV